MSSVKIPDFFIAGAPKAGTDALYYELGRHPQVYLSPLKEPCFFAEEVRAENFGPALRERMRLRAEDTLRYVRGPLTERRFGGVVSSWEDYLRLFAAAGNENGIAAIGEGSVCYLWSATAAASIAERIPHAKVILVLMDPAERAFAQYRKSVADGTVSWSFRQHLDQAFSRTGDELGVLHPFLDFGMYSAQVQRYLNAFPRDQLHISIYEDAQCDYKRWFASVLNFLGVDFTLPLKRERKKMAFHWLRRKDRQRLIDYYREDIQRVSKMLDYDLSGWLRG